MTEVQFEYMAGVVLALFVWAIAAGVQAKVYRRGYEHGFECGDRAARADEVARYRRWLRSPEYDASVDPQEVPIGRSRRSGP